MLENFLIALCAVCRHFVRLTNLFKTKVWQNEDAWVGPYTYLSYHKSFAISKPPGKWMSIKQVRRLWPCNLEGKNLLKMNAWSTW